MNSVVHGIDGKPARICENTGCPLRKPADDNAILLDDPDHFEHEDRSVLLGLSERIRIVVVSHTLRDDGRAIRIISARKATKREREPYFERVTP